jgi:tetratricopeptide (TPR) repeat protein
VDPNFAQSYNSRAIIYSGMGKNKEAIADFNKAASLRPEIPDIYLNRALSEIALKLYKEALTDCNKAVEMSPRAGDAYFLRARVYRELKDIASAEKDEKMVADLGYKPPKTLKL